jgi:hypothetical protein
MHRRRPPQTVTSPAQIPATIAPICAPTSRTDPTGADLKPSAPEPRPIAPPKKVVAGS